MMPYTCLACRGRITMTWVENARGRWSATASHERARRHTPMPMFTILVKVPREAEIRARNFWGVLLFKAGWA